jgi:hypothetical protein
MNQYRKSKGYVPCVAGNDGVGVHEKAHQALTAAARLCRTGLLTVVAVAAVSAGTGDWGIRSAQANQANGKPPVTLSVTAPSTVIAGVPLEGINVQLLNSGLAVRDSRLRVFVHDGLDRAVGANDIKIDVLESGSWKPVQVEMIDGGVMGAIGAAGEGHKDRHKSGGFAIGNKANKVWQLRITFGLKGKYTIVTAVSPDNGATQLAQPVSLNVEAL